MKVVMNQNFTYDTTEYIDSDLSKYGEVWINILCKVPTWGEYFCVSAYYPCTSLSVQCFYYFRINWPTHTSTTAHVLFHPFVKEGVLFITHTALYLVVHFLKVEIKWSFNEQNNIYRTAKMLSFFLSGWMQVREGKPQEGQRLSGLTLRSIEWCSSLANNILHTHMNTQSHLNRKWKACGWVYVIVLIC